MKKIKQPKATAKDFPDLAPAKAAKMARVVNKIIGVLWPLPPASRRKVVACVLSDPPPAKLAPKCPTCGGS